MQDLHGCCNRLCALGMWSHGHLHKMWPAHGRVSHLPPICHSCGAHIPSVTSSCVLALRQNYCVISTCSVCELGSCYQKCTL